MFSNGLRGLSLIAWIGFIFSHAYSKSAFLIYGGQNLASNKEAVLLLRVFSLYIILLAWNGPTEAFLNAAMTRVRRTN